MTKWKCSKYDCMLSPCVLETRTVPHSCPLLNLTTPEWEMQEPAPIDTTTNTLPKLTAEVFDRPDCPEWAMFAAVDANGYGYWYEENPGLLCTGRGHGSKVRLIGRFNTCVNSFIERPEKKTLPKLTAEIFDREDCPEWAEYAAVDKNGHVFVFDLEPECTHSSWYKITSCGLKFELCGGFDSSDYEHSLVRRMEQKQKENTLPDWCKVGEWVYAICYFSGESDYYKIREIKPGADTILEIEGHGADYLVWGNHIKQARLRPWTFDEAPSVLKVKDPHGSALAYLSPFGGKYIVAYHRPDKYEGLNLGETTFTFSAFADIFTQIDGAPCGVLEHFENGEWKA